jgi:hypothetical protein
MSQPGDQQKDPFDALPKLQVRVRGVSRTLERTVYAAIDLGFET